MNYWRIKVSRGIALALRIFNVNAANPFKKKEAAKSGSLFCSIIKCLNGETLATTAGAACVWVNKLKSFAIKSISKIECCSQEVQQTFFVD